MLVNLADGKETESNNQNCNATENENLSNKGKKFFITHLFKNLDFIFLSFKWQRSYFI